MTSIDRIISRLNEIDGLAFVRDAWENKAPADYGVVELAGQADAVWADDALVQQAYSLRITIYVSDGGERWLGTVQAALADCDLVYSLPERQYLYDINKVTWQWTARLYGSLEDVTDGADDD